MGTLEKEQLREAVRDTYGKVARAGVSAPGNRSEHILLQSAGQLP